MTNQAEGADAELAAAQDDLVLDWIVAALAGEVRTPPAPHDARWPGLLRQLVHHRLAGLVWPVIARDADRLAPEVKAYLAGFRDLTTRMNGANLITMRRLLPAFEESAIPVAIFKGPLIQQAAYGDLFIRPSADVDLLVHPHDFDRAAKLLEEKAYRLAPQCRSLWWRAFLGERHFLPTRVGEVTVDLHLRLQQPGAPLPRLAGVFLEQRRADLVAGRPLPVLSLPHQALLCAMNFVKALHHREPAARYVIDLIALYRRMTTAEIEVVADEADRQGLRRSLAVTQRAGRTLLGNLPGAPQPGGAVLEDVPDMQFRALILRPEDPRTLWPKRRRLLLGLCDDPLEAPGALIFMFGGELARRLLERPMPLREAGA